MKPKVDIDGKEGTTGLQIYDRLASRDDIELLLIDEDKRKDPAERKKLMDDDTVRYPPDPRPGCRFPCFPMPDRRPRPGVLWRWVLLCDTLFAPRRLSQR